jgi:ABC-type enterochelin transport system permease subunit
MAQLQQYQDLLFTILVAVVGVELLLLLLEQEEMVEEALVPLILILLHLGLQIRVVVAVEEMLAPAVPVVQVLSSSSADNKVRHE